MNRSIVLFDKGVNSPVRKKAGTAATGKILSMASQVSNLALS
jgi:hypothetical protein